jgi:hypothetical protein
MEPWDAFKTTLRRIRSLQKAILGVAVAGTSFAALGPIAPPWPAVGALGAISATLSIFTIAASVLVSGKKQIPPWSYWVRLITFALTLVAYLMFLSISTFYSKELDKTVIKGLWCTDEAKRIKSVSSQCPFLPEETLLGNDLIIEFFWTMLAVESTKFIILVWWFILVIMISNSAAVYAVKSTASRPRL